MVTSCRDSRHTRLSVSHGQWSLPVEIGEILALSVSITWSLPAEIVDILDYLYHMVSGHFL